MKKEVLAKLHEKELEILIEIDRISQKFQLKYFLVGGTLLGAIRHKGFIPWDDDLDIAMPRKDYNKFIKICKTELDEKYWLQTIESDPYYHYIFAKVRIKNSLFVQSNLQDSNMKQGIFIDIFPLDTGNGNIKKEERLKKNYSMVTSLLLSRNYKSRKFKHLIFSWIPSKLLISIQKKILSRKGKYYINYGSQYGLVKQTIPIDNYEPYTKVEFEGKLFCAPKNYDYILRRLYGDNYMELPPAEKRVTHNPVRISFDLNRPDENLED